MYKMHRFSALSTNLDQMYHQSLFIGLLFGRALEALSLTCLLSQPSCHCGGQQHGL